jgi:hypothetical protein
LQTLFQEHQLFMQAVVVVVTVLSTMALSQQAREVMVVVALAELG